MLYPYTASIDKRLTFRQVCPFCYSPAQSRALFARSVWDGDWPKQSVARQEQPQLIPDSAARPGARLQAHRLPPACVHRNIPSTGVRLGIPLVTLIRCILRVRIPLTTHLVVSSSCSILPVESSASACSFSPLNDRKIFKGFRPGRRGRGVERGV